MILNVFFKNYAVDGNTVAIQMHTYKCMKVQTAHSAVSSFAVKTGSDFNYTTLKTPLA